MSQEDATVFARVDNAERRHDPEEQHREAQELEAAIRRKLEVQGLPAGARSPDAAVRKEMAAELGVKEETLRKRQQRSKKRDEPGSTVLPKGFSAGPISDELREQVCKASNLLDAAERHVSAALQELRAAQKLGVPLPRQDRLEEALKGARHTMRQARPKLVCWFCSGDTAKTPAGIGCEPCDGRGWIDAAGERQFPNEALVADMPGPDMSDEFDIGI